jgi:hypothetical protein
MRVANRRRKASAAAIAIGPALAGGIVAMPAQAQVLDVWTRYNNLAACEQAAPLLVDFCFTSADGQVLGLTDPLLAVDDVDQALGIPNNDAVDIPFTPPAAGGPAKLSQVYNPQGQPIFVGGGGTGQQTADEAAGNYYYVPPAKTTKPKKKSAALTKPWVATQTYTDTTSQPQKPVPIPVKKKGKPKPPRGIY